PGVVCCGTAGQGSAEPCRSLLWCGGYGEERATCIHLAYKPCTSLPADVTGTSDGRARAGPAGPLGGPAGLRLRQGAPARRPLRGWHAAQRERDRLAAERVADAGPP